MALQAIYQGRHRGGVIHADNGDGKPLCINYNYLNETANASKWVWISSPVTCRHCLRSLRGTEQKPLEKQTLRERILK